MISPVVAVQYGTSRETLDGESIYSFALKLVCCGLKPNIGEFAGSFGGGGVGVMLLEVELVTGGAVLLLNQTIPPPIAPLSHQA